MKHTADLQPTENKQDEFVPNQPIWFTEYSTPEWKPGFFELCDPQPDSYWIARLILDMSMQIQT